MIQVVNKYKHRPTGDDMYIGRGSPLGNPYTWHEGVDPKFRVADRGEALSKYSTYIEWAMMNDVSVKTCMDSLLCRALRGENTNLVCYCKPKGCHGDIIKRVTEERLAKVKK